MTRFFRSILALFITTGVFAPIMDALGEWSLDPSVLARAQARLTSDTLVDDLPTDVVWLDQKTAAYRVTSHGKAAIFIVDGLTGNRAQADLRTGERWGCLILTVEVCETNGSKIAADRVESPDHRWVAFTRDHNLWLQSVLDGSEVPLTTDGIENFAFGEMPDAVGTPMSDMLAHEKPQARVMWSPDSKRLLTYRADQRLVEPAAIVRYIDPEHDAARPKVYFPRRHFPGDEHVTTAELIVFDVATRGRVNLGVAPLTMAYEPLSVDDDVDGYWRLHTGLVRWDADSERVYVVAEERGFGAYTFYSVDAKSGSAHAVFTESKGAARYVQPSIYRYPPEIYAIDHGRQVLAVSQRDGWAHLYLFDAAGADRIVRRITSGAWNVGRVLRIDEKRGWIYFSGLGKEAGDPYLRLVYRVRLNGGSPQRISPEQADHQASFSLDGSYFLDLFSTVATPPQLILRRADGSVIKNLVMARIDALLASGMILPERFHAKARDGVTDVYGVLYRPRNFDPTKQYPIIDFDYGSQNTIQAARGFELLPEQSFNELGFLMVTIDGMGTPLRSVAFHDAEDYRGAAGLEDHPGVIRQLAARYPFVDADRAGIYGCSGGGYGAALGILKYPDFYKVAVSAYGNNDQRLYSLQVGERYLGMPSVVPQVYQSQATKRLASNLRGKLLLIQGLMDDLVNPAIYFQLTQALIDADKPFDMMVFPDAPHCDDSPYYWKLVWRYFDTNLR